MAVLDEQEATALLAHELAHAVNGDATTGFMVGSARYSLGQWHMMLRPNAFDRRMSRQRYVGIAAMLSNLFTTALAALVGLGISLLSHLLWCDSQWAAYLADSLAGRAAGTEAMLSLLDKMHLGTTAHGIAQSLAASDGGDFFDALRRRSAAMPEHEWKRLRAMATLEAPRLDATHRAAGGASPQCPVGAADGHPLAGYVRGADAAGAGNAAGAARPVPGAAILLSGGPWCFQSGRGAARVARPAIQGPTPGLLLRLPDPVPARDRRGR